MSEAPEVLARLRPSGEVMRLARMGASFPTRLSFMRQLVRRMHRENWRFERRLFDLDGEGHGTAVLVAHGPERLGEVVNVPTIGGSAVPAKIVETCFHDKTGAKQDV